VRGSEPTSLVHEQLIIAITIKHHLDFDQGPSEVGSDYNLIGFEITSLVVTF
jgi:hypothetical protein